MKPILFNGDMVRAILGGRKKQTRRVCKPQPTNPRLNNIGWLGVDDGHGYPMKPTCKPGDILYVRETFKTIRAWSGSEGSGCEIVYAAGGSKVFDKVVSLPKSNDAWTPSIHMPKEAARIFLRVTNVRVERLQDAEECDIEEEGYMGCPNEHTVYFPEGGAEPCFNIEGECPYHGWYCNHSLAEGFGRDVWDKTIKPADLCDYGWDANPWVWVIEFERFYPQYSY